MNATVTRTLIAVALLVPLAATANADADGKELFAYYRCAGCHGDDGRGSAASPKAKPIAGLNDRRVLTALEGAIAKGGHEENMGSGCAETPSKAQMQAIADHVARLPK